VFALCLPLVVGSAGFGVETTYWYVKQLQLQSAADAAAYAGAMEARTGSANGQIVSVATLGASQNGFDNVTGSIQVNAPPATGPATGNKQAVEVVLGVNISRFFSALFSNSSTLHLSARAVAKFNTASDACILALDPSASSAASFAGNTSTTLTGCSVMADSVSSSAVVVQGSALVSASCVISAGGIQATSGLTLTTCPTAITQAPPVADPFASVPVPPDTGKCNNSNGNTLQPGNYCSGLSLSGNVTLKPGVYIVSGGDFKVNANANITGTGVTIYAKSGSNIDMNGNSTTQLTAPTSGTYSGMLFFSDRSGSGTNKINGNNTSSLTGAIYAPSEAVSFLGNFSGSGGCTQIVADTVQWSGSTTISDNCSAYGMQQIPALNLVKLTE
jgi:Flp pilus assembly protein TadG